MTTMITTKLTTDRALAVSICRSFWMSLNMNVVVVSASLPGMAPGMVLRSGSELNTLMMLMIAATASAGRSIGNTTLQYVCTLPAPSMDAASSTSCGIVCRPASTTNVVNGTDTNTATAMADRNPDVA